MFYYLISVIYCTTDLSRKDMSRLCKNKKGTEILKENTSSSQRSGGFLVTLSGLFSHKGQATKAKKNSMFNDSHPYGERNDLVTNKTLDHPNTTLEIVKIQKE